MSDKNNNKAMDADEDEKSTSNKISRKDDKFTDVLQKVDARSKGSKARMTEAEKEKLVKELNEMSNKTDCGNKGCTGKATNDTIDCPKTGGGGGGSHFKTCQQCKTKCECNAKQKCMNGSSPCGRN